MNKKPTFVSEIKLLIANIDDGHVITLPHVSARLKIIIKDYKEKFKPLTGVKNPSSKLNANNVKAIKRALANGVTSAELARKYDVSSNCILRIRHGDNWAWVTI
jgi:hypothetical protein